MTTAQNSSDSARGAQAANPESTINTVSSHGVAGIVTSLLEEGVSEGSLAGGVVVAATGGRVIAATAVGSKLTASECAEGVTAEPLALDTVFDLGELTEAVCTATLMMRLASAGKIAVTDRASRYLQALGVGQKSSMTLAHLLSHSAGFPSGVSIYDELVKANAGPRPGILSSSGAKQYGYTQFHNLPLKFEPGSKELVSEANFIVLGEICEIITGLSLEKAYSRYVAAPLKVSNLNFIDLTILRRRGLEPVVERFAPSGRCPRRGRLLAGEVWDENAWVMGGVTGHAGLFGVAADLLTWGNAILSAYRGDSSILTRDATRAFINFDSANQRVTRKLGFVPPSRDGGFVDLENAPEAFVTSGSTGCSVYLDPRRDMVVVFLSNAGFSGHQSKKFAGLRADIHAALIDV